MSRPVDSIKQLGSFLSDPDNFLAQSCVDLFLLANLPPEGNFGQCTIPVPNP